MKKLFVLVSVLLCLPTETGAQKKKVEAPKTEEENIVYSPGFRARCFPPVINKGEIVLKASHSLGYSGRGETYNEVILAIENEGGKKTARIVSNVNYEVNKRGERVDEKPMTEAYVWRFCLKRSSPLPAEVRGLVSGWEQDFLFRVQK